MFKEKDRVLLRDVTDRGDSFYTDGWIIHGLFPINKPDHYKCYNEETNKISVIPIQTARKEVVLDTTGNFPRKQRRKKNGG